VRGTLFEGDLFHATATDRKGYVWGYAYGHADKAGWIPVSSDGKANVERVGSSADVPPHPSVPAQGQSLNRGVDYVTPAQAARSGLPYSVPQTVVDPAGLTVYANHQTGSGGEDPLVHVAPGSQIGIRYAYDDEWSVVQLKSTQAPDGRARWGFARTAQMAPAG